MIKNFSRRDFIKNMAYGSTAIAITSSLPLLSACSSSVSSSQSYIHKIVDPSKNNVVYTWTDIMLQAVRNQSVPPPQATRAFAMAHLAGFLAVNSVEKQYQSRFSQFTTSEVANLDVAYGVAMSYAMEEAFQSKFTFDRQLFLNGYESNSAKTNAINIGKTAASRVKELRVNDGAQPNKANFYLGRYPRRNDVLRWAPTGPFYGAENGPAFTNFNRGVFPGWGAQIPWIINNKNQFLAPDFPDPKSPEFAYEYDKIKTLGAIDSVERTEDQTQIAFFWEDGPRGVTPPGHWQIIAMNVTQDINMPLIERAKIFAMMSLAQADAAITTWDSKYKHDILRPETAIRQRSNEFGNAQITGHGNPRWQSLIPTPNFPAYTSGHSTFSAVSARMLALCLGTDNVKFSSRSPDLVNWPTQLTDIERSFTSLWAAAKEGSDSREFGGIHWESDAIEGLKCGKNLADYVFNNSFKKVV